MKKNKYFQRFLKTSHLPKSIPVTAIVRYADLFMRFLSRHYEHYMFNDGRIIYGHCQKTKKYCYLLARRYRVDKSLLGVAAFLHESGKAYETSWRVLRRMHEKYNWEISKELVSRFAITDERKLKLKHILLHKKENKYLESMILHEADIIAFLADRRSQRALEQWAQSKGIRNELERKFRKINKLKLRGSKTIALPLWNESIRYWNFNPKKI